MTDAYLGTGWGFPVRIAAGGGIERAVHEQSVREAVWIILGTAPGEREMRPDFGCGIHDLVFSANDSATAGRIEESVRTALTLWEPRIEVLTVQATSRAEAPQVLLVRVEYRLRATDGVFNLVYPFYLEAAP